MIPEFQVQDAKNVRIYVADANTLPPPAFNVLQHF
jgi:hypothetical protein